LISLIQYMQVKKLKTPDLSKRQKLLVLLGVVLLFAAGASGVMKFNDIFPDEPAKTPAQEKTIDEDADKQEQTEEETAELEQSTNNSVQEIIGPTEGVGSLSWVVNKQRPLNPKT